MTFFLEKKHSQIYIVSWRAFGHRPSSNPVKFKIMTFSRIFFLPFAFSPLRTRDLSKHISTKKKIVSNIQQKIAGGMATQHDVHYRTVLLNK